MFLTKFLLDGDSRKFQGYRDIFMQLLEKIIYFQKLWLIPVGKIAEKAVCKIMYF